MFDQPFCSSPLWNSNLTWYTERPQFTRCFQSTVLQYTPVGILFLFLPYEIYVLKNSTSRDVPWGPRILVRLIITGVLFCMSMFQLVMYITDDNLYFSPSDKVGPVVGMLGFSISFILIFLSRNYGQVTSVAQFMFWLSYVVCHSLSLASFVIAKGGEDRFEEYEILYAVLLSLGIVMLVMNFFADDPPRYVDLSRLSDNPAPVNNISFFSFILHRWFDPFVVKGWRKPIVQEDLWDLNYENSYKGIVPQWERYLYRKETGQISLLLPLIQNFGLYFGFGVSLQLVYIAAQFVNPQVLNLLIAFVEERQEMWKGYLYVVLLGLTSFFIGLFDSWYWNQTRLISMRIYTALTASIYKKSLTLSSVGRNAYTAGEVVNLIAVDCSKVQESVMFVSLTVSTPIQIGLAVFFLWDYLGVSVLVGLGVLILTLPLNGVIWTVMNKYQHEQMKQKDIRVNLVNEVLNGIKVLKLYAWEKSFTEQLTQIRGKEIEYLKKFQYLEGTQFMMWNTAPFLVALGSFACFVLIDPVNNILDSKTAFVSLTLFNTLKEPLFLLPFGIVNLIQGKVSLDRIRNFLNADEIDPYSVTHDSEDDPVVVKHATCTWGGNTAAPVLKDLSFTVKQGSLVAIVGQVGAGKSSILSALLGEMTRVSGVINTSGSIAYVSQQAWMRNMSLKQNILFGKKFSQKLYDKVVESCALTDDLAMLPDGDSTEIGEKGINLSGGQKQRINLARSVYSRRDIYLFDDPLSAVDAHVGKHIFEKVIGPTGVLQKKTRLLVTHGISFLPETDFILVLKDGRITEMGTYEGLLNQRGEFADFLIEQLQEADGTDSETDAEKIWKDLEAVQGKEFVMKKALEKSGKRRIKTKSIGSVSQLSSDQEQPKSLISRFVSTSEAGTEYKSLPHGKLIDEEFVEVEGVDKNIYMYYIVSAGLKMTLLSVLAYFIFQICAVGSNIWLSAWSDDERATTDISLRNQYLIVYGVLGILQSAFIFTAVILVTFAAIHASTVLHSQMLQRILKSPMSFFDTTPTGRIVNRFSKDMDEVDNMLPVHWKDVLNQFFVVMGVIFVLSFVNPIMLTTIIPLVIFFVVVQNFYLKTSRQLKRLLSINLSPINSHLEESLTGAPTIRAFGFQDRFEDENEEKLEDLQKSRYPEVISNSWLFLRLQVIGNVLVIVTALITVINRDAIDPGSVGLSLTYVLSCQLDIYMLVRFTADLEKSIVSVERIKEYQETPQEAESRTDVDPDQSWPVNGCISFDHYSTRYRPGLDLVLSNINIRINSGEKIGIVGRTGAGKSSITLSLFRIIEAAAGRILIDDVDIAQIGLTSLRSALTIIPQDPVIFSGTLRINLDPFEQHSDRDIWRALEMANLSRMARNFPGGLSYPVSEGGINLSVGQRQLLCLVRALLRKTKILVLDEATAAVDLETDDLIQKTIREEFHDCTVLTIAHRLKTVVDSSRVMVMDRGQVVEFDTPNSLLNNKKTIFYSMARDAGLVS